MQRTLADTHDIFDLSKCTDKCPNWYGIFDSKESDGSFLINYFTYNSLINNRSTFLIHAKRDITWYSNCCRKLGCIVDNEKYNHLFSSADLFSQPQYSFLDKSEEEIVNLLNNIIERADVLSMPKTILIDDLFIIFSYLKYSIHSLLTFLSRLKSILHPGDVLIILYHSDTSGEYEEDIVCQLRNYCTNMINITPLTSGYSEDIHGSIEIVDVNIPESNLFHFRYKVLDNKILIV